MRPKPSTTEMKSALFTSLAVIRTVDQLSASPRPEALAKKIPRALQESVEGSRALPAED